MYRKKSLLKSEHMIHTISNYTLEYTYMLWKRGKQPDLTPLVQIHVSVHYSLPIFLLQVFPFSTTLIIVLWLTVIRYLPRCNVFLSYRLFHQWALFTGPWGSIINFLSKQDTLMDIHRFYLTNSFWYLNKITSFLLSIY